MYNWSRIAIIFNICLDQTIWMTNGMKLNGKNTIIDMQTFSFKFNCAENQRLLNETKIVALTCSSEPIQINKSDQSGNNQQND